eukprot:TRINITY_DN105437_c0_g1_i1.p1 TRINITY_DN105437_c0_g1~~TRINITY_DN105437_c0_g1_i1.p1  ORF type:complete len:386 (-),score=62.49 TRINITY_DN105437_c0_g1_i1:27-1127(-)
MRGLLIAKLLLVSVADRPGPDSKDPLAKHVIKAMDSIIANHVAWNNWTAWSQAQKGFWTDDFVYDTVEGFPGNGSFTGLRAWYDGEHIPFNNAFWPVAFNQMIFLGEECTGTTTTYANAKWIGPLGQLHPGASVGNHVVIRILDFYRLVPDSKSTAGARIAYNWMMIDMVHLMLQSGRQVLPKALLPEGWVQPPSALDGIPAPNSYFVKSSDTEASRQVVSAMLQHEWLDWKSVAAEWAEEMKWYGPVGIGMAKNKVEYSKEFIEKLHAAFANVTVKLDVVPCEGHFCGAHGYIHGDHVGQWLGQPATGKRVHLRFGSHWHVQNGKIVEGWTMMDFPALFEQFGVDLFSRSSADVQTSATASIAIV